MHFKTLTKVDMKNKNTTLVSMDMMGPLGTLQRVVFCQILANSVKIAKGKFECFL
jgi:hypothetical protein